MNVEERSKMAYNKQFVVIFASHWRIARLPAFQLNELIDLSCAHVAQSGTHVQKGDRWLFGTFLHKHIHPVTRLRRMVNDNFWRMPWPISCWFSSRFMRIAKMKALGSGMTSFSIRLEYWLLLIFLGFLFNIIYLFLLFTINEIKLIYSDGMVHSSLQLSKELP